MNTSQNAPLKSPRTRFHVPLEHAHTQASLGSARARLHVPLERAPTHASLGSPRVFSPRGGLTPDAYATEENFGSTLEQEQSVVRLQALARGRMVRQGKQQTLDEESWEKLARCQQSTYDQRQMFKEVRDLLGVSKEVYNSSSCLREAHAYLEMHQIPQLFDSLLARAALERPDDLRPFLIQTLTEMRQSKGRPTMGVFTDEDLETMFNMWDELGTGIIPVTKVAETLKALSCSPGAELQAVEGVVGEDCEGVDQDTFMKIVRAELEAIFSSPAFYA